MINNYNSIFFSPIDLNFFHNFNCLLLEIILVYIILILIFLIIIKNNYKFKIGGNFKKVEFYCCLYPVLILLFQIIPRLLILWKINYLFLNSDLRVKIIGHQWYWRYEISDLLDFQFDSYIKSNELYNLGDLGFLEVDNRLILPYLVPLRLVITSADVIHSWTLPTYFIKLDVISGILTVINFTFNIVGLFFGQCSEICGTNHSFIPVILEIVPFNFFKNWIITFI